MTDIPDIMERRLRALIAEAKEPGMYTPDERQSFASYWIGVISPQCLEELLDEIERLRETEEAYRELFKRSCEKTVYIAECEAEIERLRADLKEERDRPSVRAVYDTALEEAARVAEEYANLYGEIRAARHIATAIRALKEQP